MNTTALPVALQEIEKLREEELEEARAIQNLMMPAVSLHSGGMRISDAFQPVAEVGGDFPGLLRAKRRVGGLYPRGRVRQRTARGDVCGVGGGNAEGSTQPRRLMIRGASRRHAAVQYAVFDPRTGEMQIASAGTPGPLHLSARGGRMLTIQGMPRGLLDASASYEDTRITLEPGDSVLFFTDGVSNAFDSEKESFGIERLQEICEKHFQEPATEFLAGIFSSLGRFAGGRTRHDDMTAAVFPYGRE
jgi:sigma-B regulation protein RsbU (phosphoserine phosphatase)